MSSRWGGILAVLTASVIPKSQGSNPIRRIHAFDVSRGAAIGIDSNDATSPVGSPTVEYDRETNNIRPSAKSSRLARSRPWLRGGLPGGDLAIIDLTHHG